MKRLYRIIGLILYAAFSADTAAQQIIDHKQLTFVYVDGGTYMMGDVLQDDMSDDEKPPHEVTVSSFWMSACEITNAQFCLFLNEKGNMFEAGNFWLDLEKQDCLIEKRLGRYVAKAGFADYPVVEVTWFGARAFAEWIGGRLPTEAEWEYAARNGGADIRYTNGHRLLRRHANISGTVDMDRWPQIAPAGSLSPSALGLYDMTGNVWERCSDWFRTDYYSRSPVLNPAGPDEGLFKVIRGGSWKHSRWNCRNMTRGRDLPNNTSNDIGFRVIIEDTDVSFPDSIRQVKE